MKDNAVVITITTSDVKLLDAIVKLLSDFRVEKDSTSIECSNLNPVNVTENLGKIKHRFGYITKHDEYGYYLSRDNDEYEEF